MLNEMNMVQCMKYNVAVNVCVTGIPFGLHG